MDNTVTAREAAHNALATVWARWNGQKGTEKQLTRIKRQLGITDLCRMLAERGYVIPAVYQVMCLTPDQRDGGARFEAQTNAGLDY